jgi:alpha-mannosidase
MAAHHTFCQWTEMSTKNYPELNPSAGAKWVKNLTRDRLKNFHGGRYSDYNLSSVLFTQRIDDADHVKLEVWSAPGMSKPTFEEAMKQKYKPAKKVCQSFNHSKKFAV